MFLYHTSKMYPFPPQFPTNDYYTSEEKAHELSQQHNLKISIYLKERIKTILYSRILNLIKN